MTVSSRQALTTARRWVIKIGSAILTDNGQGLSHDFIARLASDVIALREQGREVIIVSSGAVAAGLARLGLDTRPSALDELQAAAAVGQSSLVQAYEAAFAPSGYLCAQILLSHDDVKSRDRYLNARATLQTLLDKGVIPIVNENDAVSYTELKFGDNDRLSAMVASLIHADLHVILTTADGVIRDFGQPDAELIPTIETITPEIEQLASGTNSVTAVGGMITKIDAARIATRSGIPSIIANGCDESVLANLESAGTFFVPQEGKLKGRKRWIAFFHHPQGHIHVDAGAKIALREKGKSLLQVGITKCLGNFAKDEVIRICDEDGTEFARGIAQFAAKDIQPKSPREDEVVHRDDLVIL